MLILKKDNGDVWAIANTNAVAWIWIDGGYIWADERALGKYANVRRAKEVMRQIFKAMEDGQPTFEMPEN